MPELSTPELTTPPQAPPQPNTPEARTPEGEIKDQGLPLAEPKPAQPAVPETYTDFTLPEGVELDAKVIDSAKTLFKELGLTQEAAQKLVTFQASRENDWRTGNNKAVEDMRADWRDKVAKDPVLGSRLDEVRAEVGKAKSLLDPQVKANFEEALNLTGGGDHPGIIRAFYDLAKLVNEGRHVTGAGPSAEGQKAPGASTRPSAAQTLYPNLPSAGARAP